MRRPSACSACDGGRRAVLDRIRHGDQSRGLAIDREEHRRGALEPQPLGLGGERARRLHRLPSSARVARRERAAVDPPTHAEAGHRLEVRRQSTAAGSRRRASATIASASGCSLPWSRLAARRSTRRRAKPVDGRRPRGTPACPASACRSCRRSACRWCAAARSPRHRGTGRRPVRRGRSRP